MHVDGALVLSLRGLMSVLIPPEDATPDTTAAEIARRNTPEGQVAYLNTMAGQVAYLRSQLRPLTYRALARYSCRPDTCDYWNMEGLCRFSSSELQLMKGIGPKWLAKIRNVLAENGLSLKGDV